MASVEGLEGLTVGRLATALGMSKAGVDRSIRQQARTSAGHARFRGRGVPQGGVAARGACSGRDAPPSRDLRQLDGIRRTSGLSGRLLHRRGLIRIRQPSRSRTRRPCRIHAPVAHTTGRRRGDCTSRRETCPPGTDVEQIGFGLEALAASVSPSRQIYGDERAAEHAKGSMLNLLGQRTRPT